MENHTSVTGWQKLFISYKCFQLLAAVAIPTFETYLIFNFNIIALSACANKSFQKGTVFVFTESWSRDQVMQRAYCAVINWIEIYSVDSTNHPLNNWSLHNLV